MTRRVRKAVFPVAGLGTRLLPATKAVPKELLPVVDTLAEDDASWWADEGSWRELHPGGVHRFFVFDGVSPPHSTVPCVPLVESTITSPTGTRPFISITDRSATAPPRLWPNTNTLPPGANASRRDRSRASRVMS